jgi:hypothetical protein
VVNHVHGTIRLLPDERVPAWRHTPGQQSQLREASVSAAGGEVLGGWWWRADALATMAGEVRDCDEGTLRTVRVSYTIRFPMW